MLIAIIDAGTSNTRVFLWEDDSILSEAQRPVGVRNTAIDGHNQQLRKAVRDALHEAAEHASVQVDEITCVLGAGMITSNVGLTEIPHVTAPISLDDLSHALVPCHLPEICAQPIYFVPGIKNIGDDALTAENFAGMDIMRGEETEAAGILCEVPERENVVLVLPGSHNKYISVTAGYVVCGCLTTLAGELLHALTMHTILADSTDRAFAEVFDEDAFQRGVSYERKFGLGHAAFMARVFRLFGNASSTEAQNYLLGLLLADDLAALEASPLFRRLDETTFRIAAAPVMQEAYRSLLENGRRRIIPLDQKMRYGLSGRGAIVLARKAHLV